MQEGVGPCIERVAIILAFGLAPPHRARAESPWHGVWASVSYATFKVLDRDCESGI